MNYLVTAYSIFSFLKFFFISRISDDGVGINIFVCTSSKADMAALRLRMSMLSLVSRSRLSAAVDASLVLSGDDLLLVYLLKDYLYIV